VNKKMTVHMFGNAHLDPVWLWNLRSGVDEALNTCRIACELLDEYPDLIITRGEVWVYKQAKELAPDLFKRMVKHVEKGRLQVVNGWMVQPDCNLPTADSFRKHCELGKKWFRDNLGVDVTVGYNIDSFGHNAMLPAFLNEFGFDSYVFSRPGQHEMDLPFLFSWRSVDGKGMVNALRVSGSYSVANAKQLHEINIRRALATANWDVGHVLVSYGYGDHGGGPTRDQIEWIMEHRDYSEDIEIIFSHPRKFFDAVKSSGVQLPVVQGELHYHAVGCYSVVHMVKQEMRRSEVVTTQAEGLARRFPDLAPPDAGERLNTAWEKVLFNQFHDIMDGSSIEPAYRHVGDELGQAKVLANEIITHVTRRQMLQEPPCEHQRLVMANVSNRRFRGLVTCEPWIRADALQSPLSFTDPDGKPVPFQGIVGRATGNHQEWYLIPADLGPFGKTAIQLRHEEPPAFPSTLKITEDSISNEHLAIRVNNTGIQRIHLGREEEPKDDEQRAKMKKDTGLLGSGGLLIVSFRDLTDAWSHGVTGFSDVCLGTFRQCGPWRVEDRGPLRATLANTFRFDHSVILWRISVDAGEPVVRMRLRMNWQGAHQIVKLVVPVSFKVNERLDGIPGGTLKRPLSTQEYPIQNFTSVTGDEQSVAIVSADCYGGDVQPDGTIRLTMLRCPVYANHGPFEVREGDLFPVTDQGYHEYEIALVVGKRFDQETIDAESHRQTNPVVVSEATLGMPSFHLP